MRKFIIRILLGVLNSGYVNQTPCKYGLIGNVDAFSKEYLASEVKDRSEVMVKTILEEAEAFGNCALAKDRYLVVLGETGAARPADYWDVMELKNLGRK